MTAPAKTRPSRIGAARSTAVSVRASSVARAQSARRTGGSAASARRRSGLPGALDTRKARQARAPSWSDAQKSPTGASQRDAREYVSFVVAQRSEPRRWYASVDRSLDRGSRQKTTCFTERRRAE